MLELILSVVLFREHNRLADEIQKLRPLWDDEQVYQNARYESIVRDNITDLRQTLFSLRKIFFADES